MERLRVLRFFHTFEILCFLIVRTIQKRRSIPCRDEKTATNRSKGIQFVRKLLFFNPDTELMGVFESVGQPRMIILIKCGNTSASPFFPHLRILMLLDCPDDSKNADRFRVGLKETATNKCKEIQFVRELLFYNPDTDLIGVFLISRTTKSDN